MRAVVGGVAVVFLVAAVWGAGWVAGLWSRGPTTAGSAVSSSSRPGSESPSASPSTPAAPPSTTPRSSATVVPPRGARLCDGGGDLRAYAGTSRTSCPFAIAVRDAFVGAGGVTDGAGRTVRARSTVTDKTYTMTCAGTGLVTCRGGTDAVVYLAP